jgi:hypothetical protein
MSADQNQALLKALLDLVPLDGERRTNAALLGEFSQLPIVQSLPSREEQRELYWKLRNELISQGKLEKGRGQGGSVRRATSAQTEDASATETDNPARMQEAVATGLEIEPRESELYDPFIEALRSGYISEYKVPKDCLLVKTAHAGSRNTGGKWTRPDVALVAVHSYPFLPNKNIEVTTFEIKKSIGEALQGVFEALAHSAFAHRTYLAVKVEGQIPKEQADDWTRVREECDRLAIGLIKFSSPGEYDTFEFISEATPSEPDLFKVNEFISRQFQQQDQEQIREWVR